MNLTKISTLFACFLGFSAQVSTAQDADTIVVLDVSGSMWGQIDGRTKIEIARDAFSDIAADWDQNAVSPGLIAYGHRREGRCDDIELLASPGATTASELSRQVDSLKPLGKTPLTDAVRLAAQELKFTENRANVILLSDGRETCDADPCAVSQELEALGIDFTAHVIGFDITDQEARSQLTCIADNTGGQYLDAGDGAGLVDAMREVTAQEAPKPAPAKVTMVDLNIQIDEQDGTSRLDQASFRATDISSGEVKVLGSLKGAAEIIDGLNTSLPTGDWKIEVISAEGRGELDVQIAVGTDVVNVPFTAAKVAFEMVTSGAYQLGVDHNFYLNVIGNLQPNASYTVSLFPANAVEFNERLDWETRFGSDTTGITVHDFVSPAAAGAYEILITQSYDLSEAIARFPVTYSDTVEPAWHGALRGETQQSIPVQLSGDTSRYGTLSLLSKGTTVSTLDMRANVGPEGPMLQLPENAGEYDLMYAYRLPNGDAKQTVLAQITVDDGVRAADADAVSAPPADVHPGGQGLSADQHGWEPHSTEEMADKALSRLSERSEFVTVCREVTCAYTDDASGLANIPLLGDFGLLEPYVTDAGRPSIDIINEWTGEWVALNPIRQTDQTTTCVDIGISGPSGTTSDTALDLLCIVNGANGYTHQMMDALGMWAADRNLAQASNGDAAQAKTDDGAQAKPAADMLRVWTVVDPIDLVPVGMMKMSQGDDGTIATDFLIQDGSKLGIEEQELLSAPTEIVRDDTGAVPLCCQRSERSNCTLRQFPIRLIQVLKATCLTLQQGAYYL